MKKKKNAVKKLKKVWNNDPKNILVPVLSIIIFIVSSFSIGIVKGLIIFLIINIIYFLPMLISKGKKNSTKNEKEKKKKKRKTLKILLLILLFCFILGIIAIILFFSYVVMKAPNFDPDALYVTDPSIVLDKDGKEIGKLGSEKRVTISYDEIPEVLIDAIIATEDSRFFEHNGVDWARFLKASAYQLVGKSGAGGASTLTMQLSKNTYTSTEDTGIEGIIRKFTDVYVSMFKIEKSYTKEQILEFYVNSQYLGKQAYGVEQVSLNYFGKSAKDLNLAEAAMIAGLFQAPGRYDPYKNPDATENRRQTVLKLMLRHGYITKEEYNVAKKMTVDKIIISKEENQYISNSISPYQSFIDTVVEEVQEKTGKNPYNTPMIIYTTLNTDIQNYLNNIMNSTTYTWENDKVQAGVAITSISDGSIAAIGGGRNVNVIDSFNYATDIKNQIGSTAKPLYDYGPAIEYNHWNTYQIVVDEPTTYSNGTPINNWNGTYEGFETIRTALSGSRNIPALKTFKSVENANIIEFVENLGLTPSIYSCNSGFKLDGKECIDKSNPDNVVSANKSNSLFEAHAIGGYNGESPLTMAAAYSSFGREGTYIKPYSFTKLVYQDTNEEFTNDIEKNEKAMSPETAYMISDMLVTTAPRALLRYYNINGVRYAAKTGTTNFSDETLSAHGIHDSDAVNDLWVVGFNTEYAIGLWYGYNSVSGEYYNKMSRGQHLRLFQAIGKKVFTNNAYFKKPSGVLEIEVESGCPEAMLPSEFTPSDLRQTELFISGYEPTTTSPRFEKLKDVSNLKASESDNTIKLSWDQVKTPDINTQSYLKEYFRKVFLNDDYLNSFVSARLNYNNSYIGNIGYNIYLKDNNGKLTLLDFTSNNKYEYKAKEAGDYTFVVKTAYSIFKANMSDGKTVNVKVSSAIIPEPDDPDKNPGDNNNPIKPTNPVKPATS